MPMLTSWTHTCLTYNEEDTKLDCPVLWNDDILEEISQMSGGACTHLLQLSMGGLPRPLTPGFLRRLSDTFPSLIWLGLHQYTLPSEAEPVLMGEYLAVFVDRFPALRHIQLPVPSQKPKPKPKPSHSHISNTSSSIPIHCNWLVFALVRAMLESAAITDTATATTDNEMTSQSLLTARALHPLPELLRHYQTLQSTGQETVPWMESIIAGQTPGNAYIERSCGLPLRVSVALGKTTGSGEWNFGIVPPYLQLARLVATDKTGIIGVTEPTPFEKMVRQIPINSEQEGMLLDLLENQTNTTMQKFLVDALKNWPDKLISILTGQKSDSTVSRSDLDDSTRFHVDAGSDSDSDNESEATNVMNKRLDSTPLEGFKTLIRRLRRSSNRVQTICFPTILGGLVSGPLEDRHFQVNETTLSQCFYAARNNSALHTVTVYFSRAYPDPLMSTVMGGLIKTCPTWSNLRVLHLREGVGSDEAANLFTALADVYSKDGRSGTCSLHTLQAAVYPHVDEGVIIATAKLVIAASESLKVVQVHGPMHYSFNSALAYTPVATCALREMFTCAKPNRSNPLEVLLFYCGGQIEDGREIAYEWVSGIQLRRPFEVNIPVTPPQLRADKKFKVSVDAVMGLLDAFIANKGLLTYHKSILAMYTGLGHLQKAASLLRLVRDRSPSYGLHSEEEKILFVRALTKDTESSTFVFPFPPVPFLSASDDEFVQAWDRVLEIILPVQREIVRTEQPRLKDAMLEVGPLKPDEVFMYAAGSTTTSSSTSGDLITTTISPLEWPVSSLTQRELNVVDNPEPAVTCFELQQQFKFLGYQLTQSTANSRSGSCSEADSVVGSTSSETHSYINERWDWTFPGSIEACLNEHDMWYGTHRVSSKMSIMGLRTFKRAKTSRAQLWQNYPNCPNHLLAPTVEQALTPGPLFVCEMGMLNSTRPVEIPLVMENLHRIHDGDDAVLEAYRLARLVEEIETEENTDSALAPTIATPVYASKLAKPVLSSSAMTVVAAFHASSPTTTYDSGSRLIIHDALSKALCVCYLDGSSCYQLLTPALQPEVNRTADVDTSDDNRASIREEEEKQPIRYKQKKPTKKRKMDCSEPHTIQSASATISSGRMPQVQSDVYKLPKIDESKAPETAIVIDEMCLIMRDGACLVYSLTVSSENDSDECLDRCPVAVYNTHGAIVAGWCGDNMVYFGGFAGGRQCSQVTAAVFDIAKLRSKVTNIPSQETLPSEYFTPLGVVATLSGEETNTYISDVQCSPRLLAAVSIYSIQLFSRVASNTESSLALLRVIPAQYWSRATGGCLPTRYIKLIPATAYFRNNDTATTTDIGITSPDNSCDTFPHDLLVYVEPPSAAAQRRLMSPQHPPIPTGNWIRLIDAHTNTCLGRFGGVFGPNCVSILPSVDKDERNIYYAGAAAQSAFHIAVGVQKLVSIFKCKSELLTRTAAMCQPNSAETDSTGEVDVLVTPGVAAESLRETIFETMQQFSSLKKKSKDAAQGRMAKLRAILDDITCHHLKAEMVTFGLLVACFARMTTVATDILDQCFAGSMPEPLWYLRYTLGRHFAEPLDKYAMSEGTVSSCTKTMQRALQRFYGTALAAVLCISPVVATHFLQHNSKCDSARHIGWTPVVITPMMIVAVLGLGYSTGGNMCMVHCDNFPGCPPRNVVDKMFNQLLDGCGDVNFMTAFEKATLTMVMMRLQNMRLEGLGIRLKEVIRLKEEMAATAIEPHHGVSPRDIQAWLAYANLVVKAADYMTTLHITPLDVDKAENGLSVLLHTIEESLSPFQNEAGLVEITDGMSRAALSLKEKTLREMATRESGNSSSCPDINQRILESVYRGHLTTLLGVCCEDQRVERLGEADLPAYLSIRKKLIEWLLEQGADPNQFSLERCAYGGAIIIPKLPIDMLISPVLLTSFFDTCERLDKSLNFSYSTLLTNLVGGGWTGCRLGCNAVGDTTDCFSPRYQLLSRVVEMTKSNSTMHVGFSADTVAEALRWAKQQYQLYGMNIQQSSQQSTTASTQIWQYGVAYSEFAVREIERLSN